MEIYGYKRSYTCTLITWLAILASGFLLRLVFYWKPQWMLYATYKRCLLQEAQRVLLIDKYNQYFVERVEFLQGVPHPSTLVPSPKCGGAAGGTGGVGSSGTLSLAEQRRAAARPPNGANGDDDDDEILICLDEQHFSESKAGQPSAVAAAATTSGQHYGSLASRDNSMVARLSFRSHGGRHRTLSGRSNRSEGATVAGDTTDFERDDEHDDSLSSSQERDQPAAPLDHEQACAGRKQDALQSVPPSQPQPQPQPQPPNRSGKRETLARGDEDGFSVSIGRESQGPSVASGDQQHQEQGIRYFDNKKIRFVWHEEERNFVRLRGFDRRTPLSQLKSMTEGLNRREQARRRRLFGENAIHIQVLPYLQILFQEVLGPFYIFQVFSVTIWFNDDYYYYGSCIIVMSVVSLLAGVFQTRRNQEQLRDTVESLGQVKVCRGRDRYEEIDSSQLVPGDVVVVPTFNSVLQFDGVLINGNVIVNESMLTGESVPVTKTPLPLQNYSAAAAASASSNHAKSDTSGSGESSRQANRHRSKGARANKSELYYDEKEHSKHTLFCGTKVLQTRYYGGVHVRALVIRVGFQTAKGELIRSIMFPKPVDFRFNKQIHKFIGMLACMALVGFTYSVVLKAKRGADLKTVLISALDLITIVVPPALPAAMTIGIIYAQSRLKDNKIFCISPRSINISGCINCVCFDKTGTLTEDNLSFNEVVPLNESKRQFGRPFDEQVMQTSQKQVERDHHLLLDNGDYSPLIICLASCHSLTIIDQKIIGDPLDLQMFEATGWVLEEPEVEDENKFDLLAPTVVRPPRRKRRTPPEAQVYASSGEYPSSASSTEDEVGGGGGGESGSANANMDDEVVVTVDATKRCLRDVGILRQFPFSSSLQRMSVITRQFNGSQYVVYAKGAPEKIASLCNPNTIPHDFNEVLHDYTHKGFRVLALAYRPLKAGLSYTRMQRATRSDIEKDLRFLGLLTLGNLLKPETIPVIKTLNRASIRCVMVTGDNMLTAVSVANECGMIAGHDRTVLLQVEKPTTIKRDIGESDTPTLSKENLQASPEAASKQQLAPIDGAINNSGNNNNNNNNSNLDAPPAVQSADGPNPLVLSVENIQLEARTESEPILGPRRLKEATRPKLVWHYMNKSSASGNPTSNGAEPNSNHDNKQAPLEASHHGEHNGSVSIDMLDDTRIHLALTGETWDVLMRHYPELLGSVCVRGTVFARMSPHQKQQLVEHLQSLQYYVGMCGDGANDSGALRAAHAGISLSDTEASVAAPFTSANANIACVPILIGEGRAALVTAFGILKYMALYSMTQFCSVLLLYTMYTNFTDMEFLYEDLFIIATFVALFGRTEPHPRLDNKAPPSSLLSVTQLASVSIQLLLVIFFQILSLALLWNSAWYVPHPQDYDHELAGHDNFAIFAMSSFQCISLAIVFSKGKPYRRSILSNRLLSGALVVITLATVVILIIRAEWNVPYISLDVLNVTLEFRALMILLAGAHFALAMLGERYIVDHLIFEKSGKFLELFGMKAKRAPFETIDRRTRSSLRWIMISAKDSLMGGT